MMNVTRGVFPTHGAEGAALSCSGCARPFGSRVAFCPFCGVQVQLAPPLKPVSTSVPTTLPLPPAGEPPSVAPTQRSTPASKPPGNGQADPETIPRSVIVDGRTPGERGSTSDKSKRPRRSKWIAGIAIAFIAFVIYAIAIAPKATLFVHVTNVAGAPMTAGDVTIDDVPAGKPEQNLGVKAGTVRIGFVLPGWVVDSRSITIVSGAAARLDLVARPLPARITVTTTPPGAAIAIGGRAQGRTPVTLSLAAETYTITASRDGYVSKNVELTLVPGESRTLSMDLALVPPPSPVVTAPAASPTFFPAPFERGVTSSSISLYSNLSRTAANVVATIAPDTEVTVVGRAEADESWLQVRTTGRAGFVLATGAIEPWDAWARRHAAIGTLDEVTPGLRAVVRGASYTLNGVKQPDHGSVTGLTTMRDALSRQLKGSVVTCVPQTTTRFECKTSSGNDIAEYYILNGAAEPGEGAPSYYFESQQGARAKKKGIWGE